MDPTTSAGSDAWSIAAFITSRGATPAIDWMLDLDVAAANEVHAVLYAVRDALPFRFAGGGKWEAMHDPLHGVYEVRVRRGRSLHRLFCVLDRDHRLGPLLVLLTGATKRTDERIPPSTYRELADLRDEYRRTRRVTLSLPSAASRPRPAR